MSQNDALTKQYLQNNERFADAVNFLVYNGRPVLKPEDLQELDTTELAVPHGEDFSFETSQKYRDVLKMAIIKTNQKNAYVIFGIENQTEIHNAMVVRNMLYDSLQYSKQVERIAQNHKNNGDKANSKADFLSGFYSTDKLIPVITIVVYYGSEPWTAARDLHSLFDADEETLAFVDNYHLHIISPSELGITDLEKFKTELGVVCKCVKYEKDKEKFRELINKDIAFQRVSPETATLIKSITNMPIKFNEKEEVINMCQAIDEMIQESKAEGRAEGKAEGRAEATIELLAGLVKDGLLAIEEAAKRTGLSVDEFKKLMEESN